MLDATRLRVLVAVARHGSVTAAAQALNYAQPSISHHMARLEAETGAKLIERSGRGIKLTEAGQFLADRAEEILGRLDAAEAELAAYVGLRQDRVRVALCGAALGGLVASAAAAVHTDRGPPEVHLSQADQSAGLRMLRAGEVDVALLVRYQLAGSQEPASDAADHAAHHAEDRFRLCLVLDEPLYLITPIPPPGPICLTDYARCRWIAGTPDGDEPAAALCQAAGFAPDIVARTDDYLAAQALVAAGLGVAVLPGLALGPARHPGIHAAELDGQRRHVLAATYGTPPPQPAVCQFIEELTRAAASSS
jgi:DNA-binding transcriptional LysR family regulator